MIPGKDTRTVVLSRHDIVSRSRGRDSLRDTIEIERDSIYSIPEKVSGCRLLN